MFISEIKNIIKNAILRGHKYLGIDSDNFIDDVEQIVIENEEDLTPFDFKNHKRRQINYNYAFLNKYQPNFQPTDGQCVIENVVHTLTTGNIKLKKFDTLIFKNQLTS